MSLHLVELKGGRVSGPHRSKQVAPKRKPSLVGRCKLTLGFRSRSPAWVQRLKLKNMINRLQALVSNATCTRTRAHSNTSWCMRRASKQPTKTQQAAWLPPPVLDSSKHDVRARPHPLSLVSAPVPCRPQGRTGIDDMTSAE